MQDVFVQSSASGLPVQRFRLRKVDPLEQFYRQVAANIRRERVLAGYNSMDALAEKATIHRNTLAYIEEGKTRPTLKTLAKIASAIGVELGRLLGKSGTSSGAALAERFLESSYAALPDVTADDIEWLRSASVVEWLGEEPPDSALYQAIRLRKISVK